MMNKKRKWTDNTRYNWSGKKGDIKENKESNDFPHWYSKRNPDDGKIDFSMTMDLY